MDTFTSSISDPGPATVWPMPIPSSPAGVTSSALAGGGVFPSRTAPAGARLVMHLPAGLAWCAPDARRGEITCWPDWADQPYESMDSAAARPILTMMGADIVTERRAMRDEIAA